MNPLQGVTFMTSLKKANSAKECKILVDAGLLLDVQENLWIALSHQYVHYNDSWRTSIYLTDTFSISRLGRPVIMLSAKQMVVMQALISISPNMSAWDLMHTIKLTIRNSVYLGVALNCYSYGEDNIRNKYPTLNFCN